MKALQGDLPAYVLQVLPRAAEGMPQASTLGGDAGTIQ